MCCTHSCIRYGGNKRILQPHREQQEKCEGIGMVLHQQISKQRHRKKNCTFDESGQDINVREVSFVDQFNHEAGNERSQEEEKYVEKEDESLKKIQLEKFIHKKGKVTRYVCCQSLDG